MFKTLWTTVVVGGFAVLLGSAVPSAVAVDSEWQKEQRKAVREGVKIQRKAGKEQLKLERKAVKDVRKSQKDGLKSRGGDWDRGNPARGWDRNGNGIITREEWRGDLASFEYYDRNHNGVVSMGELRGRRVGQRR